MNIVYNCDCMEFMKTIDDNYFELAIVDPPYGIGNFSQGHGIHEYEWNNDIPDQSYFSELYRISKNQIIWGANYYNCFDKKGGAIIWDKENPHPNMSRCEIASNSFYKKVDYVNIRHYGFMGEKNFHPCGKPIALYKWLLENYAKENDKIFDSHVGSGSSRIAAYELGFDFVGCELDKDYWEAQEKRFTEFKKKFHNEFYIDRENSDLFKNI